MDQPERPVVFIVDDDVAVRRALAFALDLEGFAVRTFASGEALLTETATAPAACLVLEERLPGASGLETLGELRARKIETPAILITSHPRPTLRAAAAAVGTPILEKPLLGDALLMAIRERLAEAPR